MARAGCSEVSGILLRNVGALQDRGIVSALAAAVAHGLRKRSGTAMLVTAGRPCVYQQDWRRTLSHQQDRGHHGHQQHRRQV